MGVSISKIDQKCKNDEKCQVVPQMTQYLGEINPLEKEVLVYEHLSSVTFTKESKKIKRDQIMKTVKCTHKQRALQIRNYCKIFLQSHNPYMEEYSFMQDTKKPQQFFILSELYICKLSQILETSRKFQDQTQILHNSFLDYLISTFIHMLKYFLDQLSYLIYLFEKYDKNLSGFRFEICPQNLAISKFYQLILLNPMLSHMQFYKDKGAPDSQLDKFGKIKRDILYTIKEVEEQVSRTSSPISYSELFLDFMSWVKEFKGDHSLKAEKSQVRNFITRLNNNYIGLGLKKEGRTQIIRFFHNQVFHLKTNYPLIKMHLTQQKELYGKVKEEAEELSSVIYVSY